MKEETMEDQIQLTAHGHRRVVRDSPDGRPFGFGRQEPGGLTAREREVLAEVVEIPLVRYGRVSEIARTLGITRQQTSQILGRLKTRGLITAKGRVTKKGREEHGGEVADS